MLNSITPEKGHDSSLNFTGGRVGANILRIRATPGAFLTASTLLLFGLLRDLLPQEAAYANVQQGFSLLVTIGAVVCVGHLAAHLYRRSGDLASACSVLGSVRSLEVGRPDNVAIESADWPLLVALLFGPFFVLLAGLGGWV
jgi:hypothetical protein